MSKLTSLRDFKAVLFLLALFWFIAISTYFDTFKVIPSAYDEKRVNQLLLIFLSLIYILASRQIREEILSIFIQNKIAIYAFIILFTLGLTSSFYSALPNYAFTELFTYIGLISLAVVTACIAKRDLFLFISTIVLGSWVFAIIFEIQFLTSYVAALSIDSEVRANLFFPGFLNVRFFNQFQIFTFPFLLIPLITFQYKNKVWEYLSYLIVSVWILILLASQSRGAIAALIAATIIIGLLYRGSAKPILKVFSVCFTIGSILYWILFSILPHLLGLDKFFKGIINRYTTSGRIELWTDALNLALQEPVLGTGPLHFSYHVKGAYAHPHNSIMQFLTEFGAPFSIILIIVTCYYLHFWIKKSLLLPRTSQSKIPLKSINTYDLISTNRVWILLFYSFILGVIYSQVSGVLAMPLPQTMLAIISGLMLSLGSFKPIPANHYTLPQSIIVQISAGLSLIILFACVTPHLTTRIMSPFFGSYLPAYNSGARYWQLGGLIQKPRESAQFHNTQPVPTN
jgi:O-antigen ligase